MNYIVYLGHTGAFIEPNILVALQGHRGDRKNPKSKTKFISKQHNQRWTARTLIYQNVTHFLPFSHARNKGFSLSNLLQTLHTCSTLILPRLAKFEEIWSSRTRDMDH